MGERRTEQAVKSRYIERKRLAAEFLTRAADDYSRATDARRRYAVLARQYGLTYSDIGTFLGVSEAAARMLVKRHSGGV